LQYVYRSDSPAAEKAVHEALAGDDTNAQISALKAIWKYDLNKAAPQASNPAITNLPELFPLLFSPEQDVRRYARRTLERMKSDDRIRITDDLVAVLKDDSKKDQRIEAIRALAALGPTAKSAIDTLRLLVKSNDQPLAIAAAAALKRILKQPDYHKLLVEELGDRYNLQMSGAFLRLPGGEKQEEFHAFERAVQAEEKQLFPGF
jgi:hypothetical protein